MGDGDADRGLYIGENMTSFRPQVHFLACCLWDDHGAVRGGGNLHPRHAHHSVPQHSHPGPEPHFLF